MTPLLILLAGCLLSVFLAGGPRQGGEGAFLLVSGLVMILFRPARATSWLLWFGGLLVLLCCSASLLSQEYLPVPSWKQALSALPEITLPPTIACDPRAVAYWLIVLLASIATALFVLGQPLQGAALRGAALFAVAGCTAYALTAIAVWKWGWHYPFYSQESWAQPAFGFFSNRNQTAGFLLTGAILCLGMIRRGFIGRRWLHVLAGVASFTLLCYCLLFLSASRGGLVFLVVGCVIWLAGLGGYRSRGIVALGVLLALIVGISFVRSDSELLGRLLGKSEGGVTGASAVGADDHSVQSAGRVPIWLDTLDMIREQPWSGSGLGSYPFVYRYHADRSLSEMTALHAESSWLTLAAEAGVPALFSVTICLIILIAGLPRLERLSGRDWPLRWGFLSAFFAELLHAFVDVPLHKPELGWWILLLGAIGFARIPESSGDRRRGPGALIQGILLLMAGIGSLLIGGRMIAAQVGKARPVPPFAPYESEKGIESLYLDHPDYSAQEVIAAIRKEIRDQPVNSRLHYLLGCMTLQTHEGLRPAEAQFRAEQILFPNDPSFPKAEGFMIAPHDTDAAVSYWKESLRRRLRLDEMPNCPIRRAESLFQSMIADAGDNPALTARLGELADASPGLRFVLLTQPKSEPSLVVQAFQDDRFLGTLTPRQKAQLLRLWYQRGDRALLAAYLDAHPELAPVAVPVRALLLADGPDPRQGCQLLRDTYHLQLPEADADDLIRPADGDVPQDPLVAVSYYMLRGNLLSAKRILASPGTPGGGEASRLRAALAIREGRWKDAVRQLLDHLHQSRKL